MEKAHLESTLDKIYLKKRAVAALAKAEGLEAAAEQENEDVLSKIELPHDDPNALTKTHYRSSSVI